MPEVMEPHLLEPGLSEKFVKTMRHVHAIERPATAGCKHHVAVRPGQSRDGHVDRQRTSTGA